MLKPANPWAAWLPIGRLPSLALLLVSIALPAQARPSAVAGPPRAPAAAYGFAEVHPAWLFGSYWVGRPWPWGWYRATPATWSVQGLASGAAISAAVNGALAQRLPAIEVPGVRGWLNFASVEALPNGRISFLHGVGALTQRGVGECQLGLLNARPARGLGVHLLNAACVVAYGRGA
jgi:hypothetical protein